MHSTCAEKSTSRLVLTPVDTLRMSAETVLSTTRIRTKMSPPTKSRLICGAHAATSRSMPSRRTAYTSASETKSGGAVSR